MRPKIAVALILLTCGCAIHKVETSKSYYESARQAQAEGKDVEATIYWKAIVTQADQQIQEGKYLATNYFLRASAYFELGEWENGFADLKQLHPEDLRSEELWIYPLYAVMLGDYYSQNNMTGVAENFYQSVLKKSSFKSSPVYILALERHVNNSIKAINLRTENKEGGEKIKQKEYEDLTKEIYKYAEEFPFYSAPHFLLGDLLLKLGSPEDSLEQYLACVDLGPPTKDMLQGAEFAIATLLSDYEVSAQLNSTLLTKAAQWWSAENSSSFLVTGENTFGWLKQQDLAHPLSQEAATADTKIRYLAVKNGNQLKVLTWEKVV